MDSSEDENVECYICKNETILGSPNLQCGNGTYCDECLKVVCENCILDCFECKNIICKKCIKKCKECDNHYCNECQEKEYWEGICDNC